MKKIYAVRKFSISGWGMKKFYAVAKLYVSQFTHSTLTCCSSILWNFFFSIQESWYHGQFLWCNENIISDFLLHIPLHSVNFFVSRPESWHREKSLRRHDSGRETRKFTPWGGMCSNLIFSWHHKFFSWRHKFFMTS